MQWDKCLTWLTSQNRKDKRGWPSLTSCGTGGFSTTISANEDDCFCNLGRSKQRGNTLLCSLAKDYKGKNISILFNNPSSKQN